MTKDEVPEMVQRMARAIESALQSVDNADISAGLGWLTDVDKASIARAAIAAMREPDRAMITALNSYAQCEGFIEEGWAAAMDAAMGETER